MNLFETNSNRQSIKYYIKEKVPLYLVIQKGIDVEYKVILIKSFMINEHDNNIWWMSYIEKENKYCYIMHSYDSKYIALCKTEEEALRYMISSLLSIIVNVDKRTCALVDRLKYISTSRKEGK
jgi:hypothetical protein